MHIARDSLDHDRFKVDLLPDVLSDLLEPRSRIGAVNHTSQKTEVLGCIVAVSPNVVLRNLGVQGKKGIHAPGLGEDVGGVAKLRRFDDDSLLNVKNVFIPKQIDPARTARELAVKERIIVRSPADVCDIEVTGKM